MPRTRRNTQVIGVVGKSDISPENLTALLDDYLKDKTAKFVVPVTNDHFTATMETLVDYLLDKEIDFVAVTDGAASRGLKSVLSEATETVKATDISTCVVNVVKDAEDGVLFALWEETNTEDSTTADTLEYAEDNKVSCLDLCDGLLPISFVEEGDEPESSPEEKPAPAARGRRAGPSKAEEKPEAPSAAASDDQDDDEDEGDEDTDLPAAAEAEKMGIRALKRLAKDRKLAKEREIGGMSRAEVMDLLYPSKGVDVTVDMDPPFDLEEQLSTAQHVAVSHLNSSSSGDALALLVSMLAEQLAPKLAETLKELVDA